MARWQVEVVRWFGVAQGADFAQSQSLSQAKGPPNRHRGTRLPLARRSASATVLSALQPRPSCPPGHADHPLVRMQMQN